jgi:carbamoyltransferase
MPDERTRESTVTNPQPRTGWLAGLNHGPHDASCALLKDGELIVAIEQERLSRRKRAIGESPAEALRYCLDHAGIGLGDLDAVALGSDHELLARWMGYSPDERSALLPYDTPAWLFPDSFFKGERIPALVSVSHHEAHAGSCFWPSGFEDCAILIMDAMGEDCSTSLGIGRPDGIHILETYPVDVSLGYFYEAACDYIGLGRENAGKLMGLAAYGQPTEDVGLEYDTAEIVWRPGGEPRALLGRELIEERIRRAVEYFERTCFPYTRHCVRDVMAYANFAASVQGAAEQVILGLAARVRKLTGLCRLVIAGGVGLNCTANGKIADSGLFDQVWIQPMAHDAGVALGSALVLAHRMQQDVTRWTPMQHAYWGQVTDDAEVKAELKLAGLPTVKLDTEQLVRRTAQVIADGGVVAWHQGRGEVGPRALGARSLLGDPRSRNTLVKLNQIKQREMWRPLAPSVLRNRFSEFFSGAPNEFMIVAARVHREVRHLIPAVVHVDGSARPQVVSPRANQVYAELIDRFCRITGIPMLVNTSLNLADEPLCSAPGDTVRTFIRSGTDAMAIGSYLVMRPDAARIALGRERRYQEMAAAEQARKDP